MFRYVVLGLLQSGKPQHGYALVKTYRDRVGRSLNTGGFYRDLQQLVAGNLVRTLDRPADSDPRRIVYQVTDKGRAEFRHWFTTLLNFDAETREDAVSFRLIFVADVDPDDAQSVLDRLQEDLWAHAKSLERARAAALMNDADEPGTLDVLPLMLDRRILHVAAEITFLERLRARHARWLAARPNPPAASKGDQPERTTPRTEVDDRKRRSR